MVMVKKTNNILHISPKRVICAKDRATVVLEQTTTSTGRGQNLTRLVGITVHKRI